MQLIEHQRKDINLFAAHLLALLQQNQDGAGFVCVALIQAIIDHWFETAYPSTDKPKGIKVWNNRLNQVGSRIKKHAEQQLLNERHLPHSAMVEALLKTLSDNEHLDATELKTALRYLRDSLAAIQSNAVSPPTSNQSARHNPAATRQAKPSASTLSSKELKQCYQSIIEHHAAINLFDPMVYRLRRHMLWSSIQSAPDKDDAGKTLIVTRPSVFVVISSAAQSAA